MKISELITGLAQILTERGDIGVSLSQKKYVPPVIMLRKTQDHQPSLIESSEYVHIY